MRRTTISLPDDLADALEREAHRRRVPVSQVAREAIEMRLGWADEGPREIPFAGIGDSGGAFVGIAEYMDSGEFAKDFADWIYDDAFNSDS